MWKEMEKIISQMQRHAAIIHLELSTAIYPDEPSETIINHRLEAIENCIAEFRKFQINP